jgi:polyadenylate-binding protein
MCYPPSFQIMKGDDEKNMGFGFVSFEEPEAAEEAVNELNGKEIQVQLVLMLFS